MTDLPANAIRFPKRPFRVVKSDCQNEKPRPVHLFEALRAKQVRTRAEIAADKIEEGYAELKAAAGSDAAQECLRCLLLLECGA